MPTFRHSGGNGYTETNRAGRALIMCRSQNLKDGRPIEIYVGMASLGVIAPLRVDYEAIVPVHVSMEPVSGRTPTDLIQRFRITFPCRRKNMLESWN